MAEREAPEMEQKREWRLNLPLLFIAVLGIILALPFLLAEGAVKMMRV